MPDNHWVQVGSGVFQRRYEPVDVSVGVILGTYGVTIIDTRNNPEEGQQLIDHVTEYFCLPVVAAINTHAHYDHTFGNQAFSRASIPVIGHHLIPQHFRQYEKPHLQKVLERPDSEPDKTWANVILSEPDHLINENCTLNLGGRDIELLPLGPGHTDTDLAVFVPDVGTWFLGDIIEESGPPMFGSGAYPLDWPRVLKDLLTKIESAHMIVPGHGNPVRRDFVAEQQKKFELLAHEIKAAHQQHVPVARITFSAELGQLWPEDFLNAAAKDGYGQLGD